MASGACAESGPGSRIRHPGDYVLDRLTALHLSAAVIEHAVRSERRDVEVRIVEVERKKISRLQILDCGAILSVTGGGASLRIAAHRPGRYRHHSRREHCSGCCKRCGDDHFSHM